MLATIPHPAPEGFIRLEDSAIFPCDRARALRARAVERHVQALRLQRSARRYASAGHTARARACTIAAAALLSEAADNLHAAEGV